MPIDFDYPQIFPSEIIAVVTRRNLAAFPPTGFSPGGAGEWGTQLDVEKHRLALASELHISRDSLKFQRQVHGAEVRTVQRDSPVAESDGMISRETGLALCVSIADCGAVLLYDPQTHTIGALHSGWRGTHLNIVRNGLMQLNLHFGVKPENILAYISPCAGGDAYEVQEDVAALFPKAITPIGEGKFHLDIRAEIARQLIENGVHESNVESSSVCTITDQRYHSYRRDREKSGRMIALIAMKANGLQ